MSQSAAMSAFLVPLPVDDLRTLRRRQSAKWRLFDDDVLPLPVAEMDFALAPAIRDELLSAVDRSDTGYAFAPADFGVTVADFAFERWGWSIDPGMVRLATDVGIASVDLLRVICEPADRVVFNTPVYAPFFNWLDESQTALLDAPLRQDVDGAWRLDLDSLTDAFAQGPGAYVLCNPHNPVGRVHSREELTEVVRLAREHGVTVISDEIHAPLVLPGAEFTPLLSVPGAAEIAVSLISASKAWNLAGLKCAVIVAGSPAMQELVDSRPVDARWRVGHLGVLATVAAFTRGLEWLDALIATLDQRRALLDELMRDKLPDIRWMPPQATYLGWLDCRAYGEGSAPRDLFLQRGRVALEPGPNFGAAGSGWVRLNFATSAEILAEAVSGMAAAVSASAG